MQLGETHAGATLPHAHPAPDTAALVSRVPRPEGIVLRSGELGGGKPRGLQLASGPEQRGHEGGPDAGMAHPVRTICEHVFDERF
jgi:hypothetical protein